MPNPFARRQQAPQPTPLPMSQFIARAQGNPNYAVFQTKFGARHAMLNLQALYDRNLRMMTPAGIWSSAQAPDYNRVAAGNTLLKVNPADLATLDTFLGEQLRQDVTKTTGREVYLRDLKGDAQAGRLLIRLNGDSALETSYYTAPPPRVAAVGAPPIPPPPPRLININKALAWAVGNPGAGGDVKTTYSQAFHAHTTRNRGFPINNISMLNAVWRKLVSGAPVYRSVNIMQPTRYPSSLAGGFILKNVIDDFATAAKPPQGDDRWYDWALYFFAAIMTSQAFTDGNKRVSRLAYGLILVDGGVDFRAPGNRLGAQLGDM